jgi:hypothetical protein
MNVDVYDASGLRKAGATDVQASNQVTFSTLDPGSYNVRVTASGTTYWYPSSSSTTHMENTVLLNFNGSALTRK